MNETGTKQPGKLRAFFGRLGGWFKQHKKFTALLVVLALAAAIVLRFLPQKGAAQGSTVSFVRTTTLQKTSLENSVSTTGTVESANVSTVTTDLKYTVKSVNVQVGDTVQAGVICTLDTEDLEKQIERAKESLTDQTEQTQEAYDKALKSYNEAKKDYDDAVTAAADAEDDYYDSWDDLNAAVNQVSALQAEYDRAENELNDALSAYNAALTAYGAGSAEATAAYNEKQSTVQTAQQALQNAQSITGYQSLVQAKDQAVAAWEQAKNAKEQAEKQLETASESLDTAKKNLDKSGSSDTLEDLQEQLTKCTLTAETSGTVTSLNATVGSICSDTVATIQDTNALKIAVTIQEYDVPNVSIGMKARITSDATDGEISGTLTQISPTATAATGGQSSSSSSGTFSAEVSVDGASSGLLIGMNANVEIVQSTTDNVFVVPYDAVGTEDDGTKYVMVKTGGDGADATFEKVTVTTGAENDYYIEISGDALSEGMEVRSSASDDSTETVDTSDMMGQGGFMFSAGGDMPSGGGQGGPGSGQGGPGGGQGGGPGGM